MSTLARTPPRNLAPARTRREVVRIADEKQIHPDPKCMDVLFHDLAFKYNGDGWYDIHPLVAEIPEFTRARRGDDR